MQHLRQQARDKNTSPKRLRQLAFKNVRLARIVANNFNANSELLTELATIQDRIVRKNVTANPNTSISLLLGLGAEFPQELLNNPIFPLLILENPNLYNDMSSNTVKSLLEQENAPESLLAWVKNSNNSDIHLAALINPNTPKSTLGVLSKSKNKEVAETAKLHVNWNCDRFSKLTGHKVKNICDSLFKEGMQYTNWEGENHNYEKQLWLAGLIDKQYIPSLSIYTLQNIVSFTHISTSILEAIFNRSNPDRYRHIKINLDILQHPNAPKCLLNKYIGDKANNIRKIIRNNPSTDVETLEKFKHQKQIINNPYSKAEAVAELANSQWDYIRLGVAKHRQTTVDILDELSQDEDYDIRLAVYHNKHTSCNAIASLKKDLDTLLKTQQLKGRRQDKINLDKIVKNIQSPELLTELAKHKNSNIRALVASNSNTSFEVIEQLSRDENKKVADSTISVLYGLARNPKTPRYILNILLQSKAQSLRHAAWSNSQIPKGIIKENDSDPTYLERQILAIQNPHTSDEDISILVKHPNSKIRQAIASSCKVKNIFNYLLFQLINDRNSCVRLALARTLQNNSFFLFPLAVDESLQVRQSVINNTSTPENIKSILKQYQHKLILNRNDIFNIYKQIVKTSDVNICQRIAQYPKTPKRILQLLSCHEDFNVRYGASQCKNMISSRYFEIVTRYLDLLLFQKTNKIFNQRILPLLAKKAYYKNTDIFKKYYIYYNLLKIISIILGTNIFIIQWLKKELQCCITDRSSSKKNYLIGEIIQDRSTPLEVLEYISFLGDEQNKFPTMAVLAASKIVERTSRDFKSIEISTIKKFLTHPPYSGSVGILNELSRNYETPQHILEYLLDSTHEAIAEQAANTLGITVLNNSYTLSETISRLAKYNRKGLQKKIVSHPNTPADILEKYAQDENEAVCYLVAKNSEISLYGLLKLIGNEKSYISKRGIATLVKYHTNSLNLSSRILQQLATFNDRELDKLIAKHPNTTTEILEKLVNNSDEIVRENAIDNLCKSDRDNLSKEFMQFLEQLTIVESSQTTAEILTQLAKSKWIEIRVKTAQHSNTPKEILLSLAKEKNETIFLNVISHPNYPLAKLKSITKKENIEPSIKYIVTKNFYQRCPQAKIKLIDKCARNSQSSVTRLLALLSPYVHPARLIQNARSTSWIERYAIAINPNTPINVKQKLSKDGNLIVRTVAKLLS